MSFLERFHKKEHDDRDPVCGRDVSSGSTWSTTHDGTTHYFCSSSCKETFDADPALFVLATAGGAR
jgi:YHS domain-containing protein